MQVGSVFSSLALDYTMLFTAAPMQKCSVGFPEGLTEGLRLRKDCLRDQKKHGAVVSDTPCFSELTEGITRSCTERGFTRDIRYIMDSNQVQQELKTQQGSSTEGRILPGTEIRQPDPLPQPADGSGAEFLPGA